MMSTHNKYVTENTTNSPLPSIYGEWGVVVTLTCWWYEKGSYRKLIQNKKKSFCFNSCKEVFSGEMVDY
jgi:hypothetical protein